MELQFSAMCETKEEISFAIIDDLMELTTGRGNKMSIRDIYCLKNLFNLFDINYVRQNTLEESKLLFISQCLQHLTRKRANIKRNKYVTEVHAFKRYLPFMVDTKSIDPELLDSFNQSYGEPESMY